MAEVLGIPGGIASISQIAAYTLKISLSLRKIHERYQDAPTIIQNIHGKLLLLKTAMDDIEKQANFFAEADILTFPPDLRLVLHNAINNVQTNIIDIQSKLEVVRKCDIRKMSGRAKWAVRDHSSVNRKLALLEESLNTFSFIEQALNMRKMLLETYISNLKKDIGTQISVIHTSETQTKTELSNIVKFNTISHLATGHQKTTIFTSLPWLRRVGFYGSYSGYRNRRQFGKSRLCVGFKFPLWLLPKTIEFEFQFLLLVNGRMGFTFIPRLFRLQNQVTIDSPLMQACRKGDVTVILQCLRDKVGSVGDRLVSSGKTPLLIAIDCGHLDAVRVLLEQGADPNIGDDNQVLPVFAALGMNPQRHRIYNQLPPTDENWIKILRLLIKHNASVHEVVLNRSLSTLNIICTELTCRPLTVEFFHLLSSEYYDNFDALEQNGCWSAILGAIRSRESAIDAIKFLEKVNVNMGRILDDGRCMVHFAAEMAEDTTVIDYFYSACGPDSVNRQDILGWTPLHWAVATEQRQSPYSCTKTKFLLQRGADIYLKGRAHPLFFPMLSMDEWYTPFELAKSVNSDFYQAFINSMTEAGRPIPPELEDDIFYDAVEN